MDNLNQIVFCMTSHGWWSDMQAMFDVWQCITSTKAFFLKICCLYISVSRNFANQTADCVVETSRHFNEQKLVGTFSKCYWTLSNIACMSGGGAAINLNFLWKNHQSLQVNIMSAARPCLLQPGPCRLHVNCRNRQNDPPRPRAVSS